MSCPERCYCCKVYKHQIECHVLSFNVSYLCPCYDCILLPVCEIACDKFSNLYATLKSNDELTFQEFNTTILPKLLKRHSTNSLFKENTE